MISAERPSPRRRGVSANQLGLQHRAMTPSDMDDTAVKTCDALIDIAVSGSVLQGLRAEAKAGELLAPGQPAGQRTKTVRDTLKKYLRSFDGNTRERVARFYGIKRP